MTANEPQPSNPGLRSYVGRTMGILTFAVVVLIFTAVHFYYATSALLDIVAVLILFAFLFFLGLSLSCLVLCARVGPGDLPSRFSAARLETAIRRDLQRVIEKARAARGTDPGKADAAGGPTLDETAAKAPPKSSKADGGKRSHWQDLDDEEGRQLANVASSAALTQRASPTVAEAELEQQALEARLRVHGEPNDLSGSEEYDSDAEQRRARRHSNLEEGDGIQQDDDAIHSSEDEEHKVGELPAHMPEMMRLRRQRKIRRGLEVVRVSEVAQRILQAIDSADFEHKREEMTNFMPWSSWCRFCNFYQMEDTRHCMVCGRCVFLSRLHCVFCGTCIGQANNKFYILFLFYIILALLMGNFLDIYCVRHGYTYFFQDPGKSNSLYYLVFVYSYGIAVVLIVLLSKYLHAEGQNIGFLSNLLREERIELESAQFHTSGESYQMIMAERTYDVYDDGSRSPERQILKFSWTRVARTVGEGLPLHLWLWPVPTRPAVAVTDDPENFWAIVKGVVRTQLRSLADEDDVLTDEDEVFGNDDGLNDERVLPAASPASSASAAAAVPPPAAPVQASTPYLSKTMDGAVAPVAVPVSLPIVVPAGANSHGAAADTVVESAALRSPATSPAPPMAKAAPAPRRKAD
ncbi:putative palmitoyl acyltransferase 6 [Leptomonas seymouri]|uniref:Palmitoyltransferase n=1 Tax=Leptomonas seymouri TaxID=5684 RepID=A0A0N0P7C7_LEPSE|nr:putative palmitoyl acyltransferase 6 [Leptomonas seymouri]|eukprot:KPI88639.1 putative palmitoyl acyltransferase 6 [Leptomonas seymouri]